MNHYFTFGQSHNQKDGTQMKDYWVRVVCDDAIDARIIFIEQFSIEYMPAPDKWAFQYDDTNFSPEYFPKGEYLVIKSTKNAEEISHN